MARVIYFAPGVFNMSLIRAELAMNKGYVEFDERKKKHRKRKETKHEKKNKK